ncbi:hypothetical protein [Georgenia sp. Z1491]|uniref:hypothetical protein n=1 Tax=Georgenia sp. Z1491 TaxID=3416707 RepID=UPI003CED4C17
MSVPGAPERLAIVLTPFARPDVVAAACRQLGMTDAVAVPSRSGVVVTRPLPARVEHTDWDISELLGDASASGATASDPTIPDSPEALDAPGVPAGAGTPEAGGTMGTSETAGTPGATGSNATSPDAPAADEITADEITADDAVTAAHRPEPSENAGEELATAMSTITRRGVVLVQADLGVDSGLESGLAGHLVAREWTAGEPGNDVAPGLLLANADDVVEDIVLGRRAPDEIPGAVRAIDVTGRGPKRRLFGRGG